MCLDCAHPIFQRSQPARLTFTQILASPHQSLRTVAIFASQCENSGVKSHKGHLLYSASTELHIPTTRPHNRSAFSCRPIPKTHCHNISHTRSFTAPIAMLFAPLLLSHTLWTPSSQTAMSSFSASGFSSLSIRWFQPCKPLSTFSRVTLMQAGSLIASPSANESLIGSISTNLLLYSCVHAGSLR
jgi:hypothetical protein